MNHFDRGKPFYPLVMNYVTQLLGFKELAVRGLIGPRKVTEEEFLDTPRDWNPARVDESIRGIEKLLGPLELRSEFQGNRIIVDADEVAGEIADNHLYLLPFYIRAAGSLLVLAHEMTRDQSYRDNGPLWEFLRHCRNAATHNGLIHSGEWSLDVQPFGVRLSSIPVCRELLFLRTTPELDCFLLAIRLDSYGTLSKPIQTWQCEARITAACS